MVRVLHVIGAMNRAGAETFLMNVYRAVDRDAVQFDFLVNAEEECAYDAEILEMGGRIFRVPYYHVSNQRAYKHAVAKFFDEHAEHPIVHGHIGLSASIYLREAKRRGRYTVAHSHGVKAPFSVSEFGYRVLSSRVRNVADHYFACSMQAGLDRFGASIVADQALFDIVNNGIELDDYAIDSAMRKDRKRELGFGEKLVCGHVGRFDSAKNHTFLLDVFQKIKERRTDSILVLVGDGLLRDSIEQKACDLGIADSIVYAGVVSDVANWLAAMDVFVFPSTNEGLGMALVEAQAAGLPCVVSEAIPDLAIATDAVQRLSLKEDADVWAQTCIDCASRELESREARIGLLREKGFDIRDTARKLEGFYLEHA